MASGLSAHVVFDSADLLEATLWQLYLQVVQEAATTQHVLHARCVGRTWKQAVGKPLLAAVLARYSQGFMLRTEITDFFADKRLNPVHFEPRELLERHPTLSTEELFGARWFIGGYLNAIRSVLADEDVDAARDQCCIALDYMRGDKMKGCIPVVASPSAVRAWVAALAKRELPHSTLVHFQRGDISSEFFHGLTQRCTHQLEVLVISTAVANMARAYLEGVAPRFTIIDDGGASEGWRAMHFTDNLFDQSNNTTLTARGTGTLTPGADGANWLLLTSAPMPTRFSALWDAAKTLCAHWNVSAVNEARLMAAVDQYSFGDRALQTWATETHLAGQLRAMIQPYYLRRARA